MKKGTFRVTLARGWRNPRLEGWECLGLLVPAAQLCFGFQLDKEDCRLKLQDCSGELGRNAYSGRDPPTQTIIFAILKGELTGFFPRFVRFLLFLVLH